MTDKYHSVSVTSYGKYADYVEQTALYNEVLKEYTDVLLDRLQNPEKWRLIDEERANTPEAKAKAERERIEREKRERFKNKWQRLHDWLNKNGCECNHDDCY